MRHSNLFNEVLMLEIAKKLSAPRFHPKLSVVANVAKDCRWSSKLDECDRKFARRCKEPRRNKLIWTMVEFVRNEFYRTKLTAIVGDTLAGPSAGLTIESSWQINFNNESYTLTEIHAPSVTTIDANNQELFDVDAIAGPVWLPCKPVAAYDYYWQRRKLIAGIGNCRDDDRTYHDLQFGQAFLICLPSVARWASSKYRWDLKPHEIS